MKSKKEINEYKSKQIMEAISTPEGRIRIASGAYELITDRYKRIWETQDKYGDKDEQDKRYIEANGN